MTPDFADDGLELAHSALVEGRQGQITVEEFLERFASGQVLVPLSEAPRYDGEKIMSWHPATVAKSDGTQHTVGSTSRELASEFSSRNPPFAHLLQVDVRWLIGIIPVGHGLIVNLGGDDGFGWSADGILEYRRRCEQRDAS